MTALHEIPARVSLLESNISQLRTETRSEFSAIRGEMATLGDTLRGEMATLGDTLRGEMATLGDTLRGEMAVGFGALREDMATFRADMIARDEETRRHVRLLHEDVVERIALIQEAMPRRGGGRRKSR